MSSLLVVAGMLLAFGGLAAISLTMDRHYADRHGRGAAPQRRFCTNLRLLGWASLLLSLTGCVTCYGWHTGPVLWFGCLSLSALLLTLLLQYAPRNAVRLAVIGYAVAAGCVAGWLFAG